MAPRPTPPPDPAPFVKFVEFIATTRDKYIGHDLAENPTPYVPLSVLKQYWTPANILSVLRAFAAYPDIDVSVIHRSYLRIFSTLVYAKPEAVHNLPALFIRRNLTDDKLPWSSRPGEWPNETLFNDFFDLIAKHQWQFFPFDFHPDRLYDHTIDNACILPITFKEHIRQGMAASVYSFDIHPEYNHLASRVRFPSVLVKFMPIANIVSQNGQGQPTRSTFVFKTYHNEKHEPSYLNESRALQRLRSNEASNVVHLYGCLRQHDSYSLILEYVDGGNMSQFFSAFPPPPTTKDVFTFWKSIFQVFNGLERIHQLMQFNQDLNKG